MEGRLTAFPTALTNAVDGETTAVAAHLNALETKVGIDSSADTDSLDYKVAHIPVKNTGAEVNTGTDDAKFTTAKALKDSILFNLPEGTMYNGKIVPSVASNNLTVALKGMDGNDPSATNPVCVRIGGVVRSVTAALSVTKNAGTNYCNAGGAALATKEIDYFTYLGYNATDGVVIGFSRVPYATKYSDFSPTATVESYGAISTITNASATDSYVVVGRFAATLSAGAGYTWTVPTFTPTNLVQRPVYETRWLTWVPTYTCAGSMTFGTIADEVATYKISGATFFGNHRANGTTGGSASNSIYVTLPFETANTQHVYCTGGAYDGGAIKMCIAIIDNSVSPDIMQYIKYDAGNYTIGSSEIISSFTQYPIALGL